MRFGLLRLVLFLASGLALLAPPGWECRPCEPVHTPAGERLPVTPHCCHDSAATQKHAPAAPSQPDCPACCSSPEHAATLPARSRVLGEVSVLGVPAAVAAFVPDLPGAHQLSAISLHIQASPLQLLHCIWLC